MNFTSTARCVIFLVVIFTLQQALAKQTKHDAISPGKPFDFVTSQRKVSIYYDARECKLDSIAANLLADDIQRVTGYRPHTSADIKGAKGNIIVIGSLNSAIMKGLVPGVVKSKLKDKWECYNYTTLNRPLKNINQALLITGSDFRGTAYGVFDLSARLGVSPFYWWADVTPIRKSALSLAIEPFTSAPPSVKFRGIFINDEDWGLQPWAAKTFEPETGDIGPKTYAKVFELLLRLKANLIWPAMHPSTRAFFHYPGNLKTAEAYQIVLGSSHAEPMLRNNVDEWQEKSMGHFNYLTNKQQVERYWENRVKESSKVDAIYSMGMRGVHDSAIEGVKTAKEAVPVLEQIFSTQREMLKKHINTDVTKVPQAFTAYKEVLEVYDAGLKVPDDVTLVWPDDNYGYIQRLNDDKENMRSGKSGVYYHASYWGRPHDYLWLSSTSPGLIREEMTKAYAENAKSIWVINVGDIKPAEYDLQLFLDMAYHIEPFLGSKYLSTHLNNWVKQNIDVNSSAAIKDLVTEYYQLAFERRPEFMGWSQTEPTTKVKFTAYNHDDYGDQAQKRLDRYNNLQQEAMRLRKLMPANRQDAFYQLVYYPVVGAAWMNKKFLYRDKAYLYARQGRRSAAYFDSLSKAAHQNILAETQYFNTKLAGGKWAGIMSPAPRNLPVFAEPDLSYKVTERSADWLVIPEGNTDTTYISTQLTLPAFTPSQPAHFVDIALTEKGSPAKIKISAIAPWLRLSASNVTLTDKGNNSQYRLWLNADASKLNAAADGKVMVSDGKRTVTVVVTAKGNPANFKGFAESNGYISIYAKHYQNIKADGANHWQVIDGLGTTGATLEALPPKDKDEALNDLSEAAILKRAWVSYDFYVAASKPAAIKIITIPTFPLNRSFDVRYAVSVDGESPKVVSFKTVGRSEEWKQNVLSNQAMRTIQLLELAKGKHTLRIYMIDPGVILDKILIDLGGLRPFYGQLPETTAVTRP